MSDWLFAVLMNVVLPICAIIIVLAAASFMVFAVLVGLGIVQPAAAWHYYLTCEPGPVPIGRIVAQGWRCR